MPPAFRASRPSSRTRARDLDPAATSPFPPAKSDDEIAALVVEMGLELGVPRRRAVPSARTGTRPPARVATAPRARHAHAPPPVPDWALDTISRRPSDGRRAS